MEKYGWKRELIQEIHCAMLIKAILKIIVPIMLYFV